ncbi:voltage-dependent calcium channel subunit alpha-2/delta-4 [Dipodomys spectabilis]|uniref:voltage-dependent calcium channel subunit alpha-2/delta-4 n=1 Tax=Dipodomys spectabilis TaxID=105255 RepID=UPI001C54B808|nr:voltage-dependent calcium channel subunit alpha-2/delta-4 [Dipodomys spectabilis]
MVWSSVAEGPPDRSGFRCVRERAAGVLPENVGIKGMDIKVTPPPGLGAERVPRAVGVQMRVDLLRSLFGKATQQGLDCYIIDNNAFILVSARPQETGRFLGQVDGALMAQLLDMGVFSQVTMYDYQAMCKAPAQRPSAAHPLASPLSACLAVARWLMHELLLSLLEWSSWGSWLDRGAEAHKHKKQDVLHPCDTEYPVFVHQAAARQASGAIPCGACWKAFAMQQIPRSNLLLLATDPDCSCSDFPPILREAAEVRYNASVKCERMRSQKPRRRPDACHAFHPEENAQDCGGASHTWPSLPLLLLTTWGWLPAPWLL